MRQSHAVQRLDAEKALLSGLQERLLADDAIERVRKAVAKIVDSQSCSKPPSNNRRQALETEIENLTDAIASGGLKSSPAIAERLKKAEIALAELREAPAAPIVRRAERLLPRIVDEHRAFVADLAAGLAEVDVHRARATLRSMFGPVRARQQGPVVQFEVLPGGLAAAALSAAGATADGNVVAGVHCRRYSALVTAMDILSRVPRSKPVRAQPSAP